MTSQPDLGNNGNKKQETRNILRREKKTGTDFQSFPCFCCNQLVVLDGCEEFLTAIWAERDGYVLESADRDDDENSMTRHRSWSMQTTDSRT